MHPAFNLNLGRRIGGETYQGKLDEIALYNRPMGPAEIALIHQAADAGKCLRMPPTLSRLMSHDFGIGTPVNYLLSQILPAAGPGLQNADAGSAGQFLRLIHDGVNGNVNAIAFDQTAPGLFQSIQAEFDFRLTSADLPADGFTFMLIPTSVFGITGPGYVTPIGFEEPNISGVFAVGFDVYRMVRPIS